MKSRLYRQGGLEKYTWEIARDFCALGAHVTLLTTGEIQPPFSQQNLKVVSLPTDSLLSFLSIERFDAACADYLKKYPTPIVFSLDRNRHQTHIRAGNGVHCAYLKQRTLEEGFVKKMSFFFNPLHQVILKLEKQAFEDPDLKILFTNSEMVKREILQCYATDPAKICTVHNGVHWYAKTAAFEQWQSKKEEGLTSLGLDPKAFQFLLIGHNFYRKGLEKLLPALEKIKNEHFQLSIVGKDKHLRYFQQLANYLEIDKKIIFFGDQRDTTLFYQCADSLLVPSLYDPFANVTVEALSLGVPVISSKYNGGHEVVTPQNGMVIDCLDDISSFAKILQKALSKPKTAERALLIRQSVQHLDFSNQLRLITEKTLQM